MQTTMLRTDVNFYSHIAQMQNRFVNLSVRVLVVFLLFLHITLGSFRCHAAEDSISEDLDIASESSDTVNEDSDIEDSSIIDEGPDTISEDLLQWNDEQQIHLLEHQLRPIDYLEKHPDLKGLLIYHYLGTGKTFLSIGCAERLDTKEVWVVVPDFLVSHWKKNIRIYGVKDASRYKIIPQNSPQFAIENDPSEALVIVDESHRIINKMGSTDMRVSQLYSDLYLNLQKAKRVLSLTGTPIFSNVVDLAAQVNFVSGENLMPLNDFQFRRDYTLVNQATSIWRGHIMESRFLPVVLGVVTTIGITMVAPSATLQNKKVIDSIERYVGGLIGLCIGMYQVAHPVGENTMRRFNAKKINDMAAPYISYYNFDRERDSDYPTSTTHEKEALYNDSQLALLFKFANNALTPRELIKMQADDLAIEDTKYVEINSYRIQKKMKENSLAGVSIGNMFFRKGDKLVRPDKFVKALEVMESTDRPVVIYSNFYHNGILAFKKYLDIMGYEGNCKILDPNLPEDEYDSIIEDYNEGRVKFLLLHPEITEGISLKGTAQMHILEPSESPSGLEQIKGRVVRYQSHIHLPENQRHVDIYIWRQALPIFSFQRMSAARRDWLENFHELNYYGGASTALIDINSARKNISPDKLLHIKALSVNSTVTALLHLLKTTSIEVAYEQ